MRNSPNMSYCQFENTAAAVGQCIDTLRNVNSFAEFFEDLSAYERSALRELIWSARELSEAIGDVIECEEELEEA